MITVASVVCLLPDCGTKFIPRHRKHKFCQRKCFLKWNRKKTPGNPSFRCPWCNTVAILPFSPRQNHKLWMAFKCPGCGKAQSELSKIAVA